MFTKHDVATLRQLAKQIREVAQLPEQVAKKELWRRHTSLKGERPVVFVSPDGAWNELLPWESLTCETVYAKNIEYELKSRLVRSKYLTDDVPIEEELQVKTLPERTLPLCLCTGSKASTILFRMAWSL